MSLSTDGVIIHGGFEMLSKRLLDYGNEAYSDLVSRQRVIMWIFIFYDENDLCPACKQAFSDLFDWLDKYNLREDPVRCVRTVIEPEPEKNLIYTDLGMQKLPAIVFCNENGLIYHVMFHFPEQKWLDTYILPYIQDDGKGF